MDVFDCAVVMVQVVFIRLANMIVWQIVAERYKLHSLFNYVLVASVALRASNLVSVERIFAKRAACAGGARLLRK